MKQITKIFMYLLAFFAVAGIIFILTLINTKLLLFLNWYEVGHNLDKYFALISGLAYALGSIAVVIWYNEKGTRNILLKLTFVLLDGIHVYIYQNVSLADGYLTNVASIVFAIQTVLILYFIGSVVDKILRENSNKENNETKFINLLSNFKELKTEFKTAKDKYTDKSIELVEKENQLKLSLSKNQTYSIEIAQLKHDNSILKTENENLENQDREKLITINDLSGRTKRLTKYYYLYEKSRIRKMTNPKPEQIQLLNEAISYLENQEIYK